ncbi:molybdopterin-dependent oxidoreductase [Thalassococcus lentus]|uniref:Molybdopterin-dependent oxidoreductase n=1 Tax=Thalassococcus lentus TaxID=1210524 RepID=A0ABT4XPR4_9RHOB|nr:molybdopterin-dependent oxidoreductase [Thalassococcus lentus]MDA7423941.1 molybdopterin-dependent oxidoreductase [Thalassococcus lentus]
MTFHRLAIALTFAFATFAAPLYSDTLPKPTGPVILTISGEIENTNVDGTAQFDRVMLRALDNAEIVTETIWTPATHTFTGVRLETLLEHVGAKGGLIKATAINDYTVEIPTSDATAGGPIVAFAMDGQQMSRRDKGPLWVIYPFSSSSDYRTEVIYSRSIWQLDRMTIEE